jgi:acetyl-CoA synthetase
MQNPWRLPDSYNIGVDVALRQPRDALALIEVDSAGGSRTFTFGDIGRIACRFANVLREDGFRRGDRLAILLSQEHETAVAHVAAYLSGLIAVPLFVLFGEEALEYRLSNSGASGIVTDRVGAERISCFRDRLPELRQVYCVQGDGPGARSLDRLLSRASEHYTPVATHADDPALIIYTSGTTGAPKGVLHAHRVLLGHLPGVEVPHDGFPQPGDRFWTPADWAWIGGLLDVLLPAWHHGVSVVAHRAGKFDPEAALALMARHNVRNVFMPPTSLRLLRQSGVQPRGLALRTIGSGGESLGADVLNWGHATFGLSIREFYGQTECNLVLGNGLGLPEQRPGWTGTPLPAHTVAIVDADGKEQPAGAAGVIAVRRPDPVMFLGYWQNEAATKEKFAGDWLLTGDQGVRDEAGYFRFIGRDDDIITSAGYRIGPGEVESCLLKHPAVALAAVVGVPDTLRTEVVKAVIIPAAGVTPSAELARELQEFVRQRLAAHEYPRIIEFRNELPTTATGKVVRRLLRGSTLSTA